MMLRLRALGPRSPFKAFADSIRQQVKENRELQENVKLLQDESSKLSESETLKRAKEAYSRTRDSETLRKGVSGVKKTAGAVGSHVRKAAKGVSESELGRASARTLEETGRRVGGAASAIGKGVHRSTEPIRKTRAYSELRDQVSSYVDESGSRYTGYVPKDRRRKAHEARSKSGGLGSSSSGPVQENPEAGSNLVLHKDSAWKESWRKFKEENKVMQGIFNLHRTYEDSENPMVERVRAVTDRISDTFTSIFDESEQAKTVRRFRETVDPSFEIESFMHEARTYIVPELLDAYLAGDVKALRQWCSEATYNVLTAGIKTQIQQGLVSDSKIVDIRRVELVAAKILENDVPVLVISFDTQEIVLFRSKKTGKVVYGKEDEIFAVRYAAVLTKTEEDLMNKVTGGWRVIDMAKHHSRPTW
ncbi:MAG: hypothetical protein DHS80DRAFT_26445 [Piptocephalis tieghemiana]|nr:MAG: hypothetical protein DHS80DRAFT_26445 [Piptocephalis tieghemiana]